MGIADIDWFVPHQGQPAHPGRNCPQSLGISPDKVISTVAVHGNTSSASVPLALQTAVEDGRIKRGDLVLLEAMGVGLPGARGLVRW